MSINIELKINDTISTEIDSSSIPVRTTKDPVIFSWNINSNLKVSIDSGTGEISYISSTDQYSYRIVIADNSSNIGTDLFIGNCSDTGVVVGQSKNWKYKGKPLSRSYLYYGQIKIVNDLEEESEWLTFYFLYNSLPVISNIILSPETPNIDQDLTLSYTFYDEDGDIESTKTIIRWFKNGIYQKQFDGLFVISSKFLTINDIWFCDILPFDGYEYGSRYTSDSISIIYDPPIISSLKISPSNPNENDILKADYIFDGEYDDSLVSIRWFLNDTLLSNFNNSKYFRYNFIPGNRVRYEVMLPYGASFSSSDEVTISSGDFSVYDITVDGTCESLEVSTIRPVIKWKVHIPYGKTILYTNIKIGTFYDSDNVYNGTIYGSGTSFTVPENILKPGMDYYLSISTRDTIIFDKYFYGHFRIIGSRWQDSVSNNIGWTIETIFIIDDTSVSSDIYQVIRISDGARFGEVRIFNGIIGFLSSTYSYVNVQTTGSKVLTIVGKGDNIKIYLDRNLIIDGEGLFSQETTDKILEIGNPTSVSFSVKYKYFYYSVSGDYLPKINPEFANIKFYDFLNFSDTEIVGLKGYIEQIEIDGTTKNIDKKVFGVNPDNVNKGGSIYSVIPGDSFRAGAVSRTFSPINKIRVSPDGKRVVLAHAKGISIVDGYYINPFDYEINFANNEDPISNGWNLVKNINGTTYYFDDDGFNINTIDKVRDN